MNYLSRYELENLNLCKKANYYRRFFHPSKKRFRQWVEDLAFMEMIQPKAESYFYWHFKRIEDTIYDFVLPIAKEKEKLLDIGSDPYFWLLLKQKYKGEIICTSTESEIKKFIFEPIGDSFLFSPIKLIIGENNIPLEEKSIDVVLLAEVIEHLKIHPQLFLLDVHRILKSKGRIVITTPNLLAWKKICGLLISEQHPYDSTFYGGYLSHSYEYTPYQLIALLRHVGFKIKRFETRNVYLNDRLPFVGKMLRIQHMFNLAITFKLKLLVKQFQRFNSTIFIVAQKDTDTPNQKHYDL